MFWFWDWFLFFDSFSSLERRNGKSYERGEVKRRYSSFLGDFEKEYIFPLDCRILWMDTVLASEERVKWLIEIVISFVEESLFNKSS